jgi:hypothetical protein
MLSRSALRTNAPPITRLKRRLKRSDLAWETVTRASAIDAQRRFRSGCRGSGNRLEIGSRTMIRDFGVSIVGDDNVVTIGRGCWMTSLRLTVQGNGNRVSIGSDIEFRGPGLLWIENDGGALRLDDRSTFEPEILLAVLEGAELAVGVDCMFSTQVEIRTGDSHHIYSDDAEERRINPSRPVRLGDHVWVGARAMVLKGVAVADGVVIGAGAVVSRDVTEPNSVVAGNPARVVRRGVRWRR